jgi:DNA-directed RNA polymerase specialized sigma24 family protein
MIDLDVHLAAIVAGDPDAFGRWVAGAEPAVRKSLATFAARADVESVLQEALLRLWQIAPRFEPDGRENGLLRLCHRIARNLALDELRRARRLQPGDEDDPAAVDPTLPDPLLQKWIEECRRALPQKPAAALAARLENAGADPDEVLAARLGMKPNTFLQNFTRARKLLADCLRAHGVEL